jgi:hypothetical protein
MLRKLGKQINIKMMKTNKKKQQKIIMKKKVRMA